MTYDNKKWSELTKEERDKANKRLAKHHERNRARTDKMRDETMKFLVVANSGGVALTVAVVKEAMTWPAWSKAFLALSAFSFVSGLVLVGLVSYFALSGNKAFLDARAEAAKRPPEERMNLTVKELLAEGLDHALAKMWLKPDAGRTFSTVCFVSGCASAVLGVCIAMFASPTKTALLSAFIV